MAGGKGTKEIATRYPVTSGLTAKSNKQTGRTQNLIPQNSKVPEKLKKGIY